MLPVSKVPGEDNMADLMTKHLGSAKIKKNIELMRMKFEEGRATKAAQLHMVNRKCSNEVALPKAEEPGLALWDVMSDRFIDKRGGDFWKSRGEGGIWHRVHAKPRRSLFTPYKVAKGPTSHEKLNGIRFTKGVTQSGHKFEFHDCWQKSESAHRILDEPWIGCTTFVADSQASLLGVQSCRPGALRMERTAALEWSEILAE